jgi:pimeloyl-ACP methyl ester carboxylesterase
VEEIHTGFEGGNEIDRKKSPALLEGNTQMSAPTPSLYDVGTARISVTSQGTGEALLLIHGWPLSGFTWRKVLPALARRFSCYVVDLPGAGATEWGADHDFSFAGQAAALKRLVDVLGLGSYRVLAQDTGATIARQLALIDAPRAKRLALINTEIPGHRPPWVRLFQASSYLPLSRFAFRTLLGSRAFLRSSMGFGGSFCDLSLIDGEFQQAFIQPLLEVPRRLEGQLRYLRGIDWALLDGLADRHREIQGPVLLVWGEEDPTFPIERARAMVGQFTNCGGLVPIARAKLLPQEEQPEPVCAAVLPFLAA